MIAEAGHWGEDVRNDCHVQLSRGSGQVRIESPVSAIYGRQIEALVRQEMAKCGLEEFDVEVFDSGAFNWCLRARIEAAAAKAGKGHPPQAIRPVEAAAEKKGKLRTRLYLPGNTPKFMANAGLYGAEVLILDLEDAVPEAEKAEARILVRHALENVDFGPGEIWIRINRGEHEAADLSMVRLTRADAILLPKVESPEEVASLGVAKPVVALLESAKGIARAHAIAQAPNLRALAFGMEDYRADIGAARESGEAMAFAHAQVVNAARSAGLPPLASVWSDLDDEAGFLENCRRMKAMGFEGIGCLHPSQVPLAIRAWQPDPAEIEAARQIVEAFDQAGGAVRVGSRMVDAPVADQARRVLADAENGLPAWRIA